MHLPVRHVRRRILAVALGAIVLAGLVVLLVPAGERHPGLLPGASIETLVHRRGLTGWLVVEERSTFGAGPNAPVDRRYTVHSEGAVEAALIAAGLVIAALVAGKALDHLLRARGRCDVCGYVLRGLPEGRGCPECGEGRA